MHPLTDPEAPDAPKPIDCIPPPQPLVAEGTQQLKATDVTERGVTFCYLLELVESGVLDREWTIQEVVEKYVRPVTSATGCCLFDLLPARHAGKPRFFVSHTWSRTLGSLLDLLQQHFGASAAATELIWLDIVAINQHPYVDKGCLLNEDVANLGKVLHATEQTLFCLDQECVSLSRIWCLYEVWQTFLAKGVAGLMVLMPLVGVTRLKEVFETFDVKNARATQDKDRKDILASVEASIGATRFNLELKAALVDSAVHHATHTDATGLDEATLLDRAAAMLNANGHHAKAEPMYRKALESRTRVLGADHPVTIASSIDLAHCVDSAGRRDEAEAMHHQALEARTRVLGPEHLDTIGSMMALAKCIDAQGRHAEAEPKIRQALEAMTRVLGADHPDTITSVGGLANCIYAQGRLAEAEPIFRQALEEETRVLGADHPSTIRSVNNLANCIDDQGRRAEAETMYRRALEGKTRVYGADHPSTVGSVNNLATCIYMQGRRAEAEPMMRRALAGWTRVLGADHPVTMASADGLENCFFPRGRRAEAELQQSLEALTQVLGADHPETLDAMSGLANCIDAQGRHAEAEPMLRQALEARTRVLGADHPDTIASVNSLAACVKAQGC